MKISVTTRKVEREIIFPCQLRFNLKSDRIKFGEDIKVGVSTIECEECDDKDLCPCSNIVDNDELFSNRGELK